MVIGNYEYGIGYLPDNCMAYRDGYRYGAYKEKQDGSKQKMRYKSS